MKDEGSPLLIFCCLYAIVDSSARRCLGWVFRKDEWKGVCPIYESADVRN